MSQDERTDVVIIGGGPNGMTTAAYLAKCGLRVCVLEERTECGGACETQEPIPGVRIYPHAMLMYASPSAGVRAAGAAQVRLSDVVGSHGYGQQGEHGPSAFEMNVTSPDYHLEGEDAPDRYKKEMDAYMIEDGIVEPGDWWYASPYYIPQEGKIPANRQ